MDLRQMEYAVTIADELNFTRAAALCHIGQSGLSHQISELEKEIGTRLFDRTSRSVRLTPAGEAFVSGARRVLQTVRETSAEIAWLDGRIQGQLRVGTISITGSAFDLLDLLREYQETHPAVELVMSEVCSVTAAEQLVTGEIEVAVLGLLERQMPAGLAHHLLRKQPLVVVVGRHHRLRGTGVADLTDLAEERFLECSPDTGLRLQVDGAFDRARARRRSACALRRASDLSSLALQGIGVTVVPRPVADRVLPSDCADCVLRIDDPQAVQPLALAYRDPAPISPASQAFARLALARLSQTGEAGAQ